MSDPYTDKIMSALTAAVAAELDAIGADVVEDLKAVAGESFPPASQAGEPPRRRSGGYVEQFAHELVVDETADRAEAVAGNPDPRARWLEKGTSRMEARPHFAPVFADWQPRAADRMRGAANAVKSA